MEYGEWYYEEETGLILAHKEGEDAPTEIAEVLGSIANAHLIAQAPKLYEACKAQHNAMDILFAMLIERDNKFFPSKSGLPWEAVIQGNQAIAKVEK